MGGVTDSAGAGDEDHPHGHEWCHHLGVVAGTAGEVTSVEAEFAGGEFDGPLQFRRGGGGVIVRPFCQLDMGSGFGGDGDGALGFF